MNLVLIHIGDELPSYINDTVEQIRKFYNGDLYFVKSKNCNFENNFNVKIVDYEFLIDYHRVKTFNKVCTLQGFWNVTCQRFIILESLMNVYHLDKVVHIENDVLIYNDPNNLSSYFSLCKDMIAINPTGPEISTGAFVYIDNIEALSFVNEKMLKLLKTPELLLARLTEKFISEMKLLNIIQVDYPEKVKNFPILPYGEFSDSHIDLLFDCATWGQLLGGTPNGVVGADELQHHWIGKEMFPERKYEYLWKDDEQGRRCIFIVDKNKNSYKLNNLHVHCKRLQEFMS